MSATTAANDALSTRRDNMIGPSVLVSSIGIRVRLHERKEAKRRGKLGEILSLLGRFATQHARSHAISPDEVMPGCSRDVQHDQGEQDIGKQDMPIFVGAGRDLVR